MFDICFFFNSFSKRPKHICEQEKFDVNQVFEILDANKNGTLEESEVRDWFSAMIKNHQPGREFDE